MALMGGRVCVSRKLLFPIPLGKWGRWADLKGTKKLPEMKAKETLRWVRSLEPLRWRQLHKICRQREYWNAGAQSEAGCLRSSPEAGPEMSKGSSVGGFLRRLSQGRGGGNGEVRLTGKERMCSQRVDAAEFH